MRRDAASRMKPKTAVIVGGGLGGLAVALRLQAAGWQATVCEAGPDFGGKMNRWSEGGFHFDTGPSLITMPWIFRETFAAGGGKLEEHVELQSLDPIAEYRFDDGTRFGYTSVLPDWLATLKRIAPGEDQNGFFQFLALGAKLFEVSKQTFFRRSPFEPPGAGEWRALRDMPLRRGWGNYQRTVEGLFRSPHLRQLYGRYPTYVGSSPWRSPATLAVIPYIEFAFGGYAVRGGLYRIVEGLLALGEQRGVAFLANARVDRILTKDGAACGVELESGVKLAADTVVMNGDYETTDGLLGKARFPRPDRRSMSGFVLLYGLRKPVPGIHQHTVCFSADYRREFSQIFDEGAFPDDPTVYVNASEKGDSLFVMANAPGERRGMGCRYDRAGTGACSGALAARGFSRFRGRYRGERCLDSFTDCEQVPDAGRRHLRCGVAWMARGVPAAPQPESACSRSVSCGWKHASGGRYADGFDVGGDYGAVDPAAISMTFRATLSMTFRATLWAVYAFLWLGGLIAGGVSPGFAAAAPLFLTIAGLLAVYEHRDAWKALLSVALLGIAIEIVGVRTGIPFGRYVYTATLGWAVWGVPLAIGFAWLILIDFVRGITGSPVAGGVLMGGIDLLIDPVAAGPLGYWRWLEEGRYFGIPAINFVGWVLASTVILSVIPKTERRTAYVGWSVVGFFMLLAFKYGLTVPGAIGCLLVGWPVIAGRGPLREAAHRLR